MGETILGLLIFIMGGATGGMIINKIWIKNVRQWEKDGELKWLKKE